VLIVKYFQTYCVLSVFIPEKSFKYKSLLKRRREGRQMEKSDNEIRNLSKNTPDLDISHAKEIEMIKLIQDLNQKIKLLENKNRSPKAITNQRCIFKETCYTAKSNTNSCPCEQYR
jgi:hypothetical protein